MKMIVKPNSDEFAPYATMYNDLLPDDGLVLKHLKDNFEEIRSLVAALPEARLTYRYAEGKWTIKEILVHVIDDERIYAYRTLRFARNDNTELPGFEQDEYTDYSRANERDLENILCEYEAVRRSTIAMFNGFDDEAFTRAGIASGNIMSVRAAAYHIAGHERHHFNLIKSSYL